MNVKGGATRVAGTNLPRTTATAAVIAAAISDHAIIPEPEGFMTAAATTTFLFLAVLILIPATAACTSSSSAHLRLQVFEGEQQPACCALLRPLQPSAITPTAATTSSRVQRKSEHVLNLLLVLLLLLVVLLLLMLLVLLMRRWHAELAKREPRSSVLRRHP
jgi:hypothetical protein